LVVKSTVPVGTGTRIRSFLDDSGLGHVGYAANPEFTAEGKAVTDFLKPDRIVVGTEERATAELVTELHQGVQGPLHQRDRERLSGHRSRHHARRQCGRTGPPTRATFPECRARLRRILFPEGFIGAEAARQ
jgi:hypothetical protein